MDEFGLPKLILVVLSGLAWTLVYIGVIHRGRKDHVHGMPLFALGLNFAWESLYSIDGFFIHKANMIMAQNVANAVWCLFDIIILIQFFKYGKEDLPGSDDPKVTKWFIPYALLALAACYAAQFAFYLHVPDGVLASQYSAFAQNAIMSVAFLTMFMRRHDAKGQSLTIAIAKWIGTLAPTILGAFIEGPNIYILLTGIICFVYDLIYIVVLAVEKKRGMEVAWF